MPADAPEAARRKVWKRTSMAGRRWQREPTTWVLTRASAQEIAATAIVSLVT
jgi:hypothetical protein